MASSIKNEKVYTQLRKQGDSKEKAARIANASAARGSSSVGRKGGKSGSYDGWAVPELRNEPSGSASADTPESASPNWFRRSATTEHHHQIVCEISEYEFHNAQYSPTAPMITS